MQILEEIRCCVDLSAYSLYHPGCKTLHCSIGWMATYKHFKDQGLGIDEDGDISYSPFDLDLLFGKNAYVELFDTSDNGDWDSNILRAIREYDGYSSAIEPPVVLSFKYTGVSDKELALARLTLRLFYELAGLE